MTETRFAFGHYHRFLPAADPGESRTLLLLHGTGGTENSFLEIGINLVPGANLLAPRGRISEGGANRFFRRFAEGIFDEGSIREEAAALANFVADAAEEYRLDPDRVFAIGHSNGANIAAALMLLHPSLLRGAAMIRPMMIFAEAPKADLSGRHALMLTGTDDPIVSAEQAESLETALRAAGAKVRHEWLPTGHQLVSPDLDLTRLWLADSA